MFVAFLFSLLLLAPLQEPTFLQEQEDRGYIRATVSGAPFNVREDQYLRGLLLTKVGTVDGRVPNKSYVSLTAYGNNMEEGSSYFEEKIMIDFDFNSSTTIGEQTGYSIGLRYKGSDYYVLQNEPQNFTITSINWEDDKKHFRVSATYECKMRTWGYPSDGKPDATFKGSIENIRVTVPTWLASKFQ